MDTKIPIKKAHPLESDKTKYKWKRKVRITLPAFLCALVPDAALTSINRYLEDGKPEDLNTYKKDEVVRLKILKMT